MPNRGVWRLEEQGDGVVRTRRLLGAKRHSKDRERWESVFKERQMSVGLHLRSLSRESIKVKLDYRRCEFGLQ